MWNFFQELCSEVIFSICLILHFINVRLFPNTSLFVEENNIFNQIWPLFKKKKLYFPLFKKYRVIFWLQIFKNNSCFKVTKECKLGSGAEVDLLDIENHLDASMDLRWPSKVASQVARHDSTMMQLQVCTDHTQGHTGNNNICMQYWKCIVLGCDASEKSLGIQVHNLSSKIQKTEIFFLDVVCTSKVVVNPSPQQVPKVYLCHFILNSCPLQRSKDHTRSLTTSSKDHHLLQIFFQSYTFRLNLHDSWRHNSTLSLSIQKRAFQASQTIPFIVFFELRGLQW